MCVSYYVRNMQIFGADAKRRMQMVGLLQYLLHPMNMGAMRQRRRPPMYFLAAG